MPELPPEHRLPLAQRSSPHSQRARGLFGVRRPLCRTPRRGGHTPGGRRARRRTPPEQEADNAVHRRARARFEHVFSRMKNWKILRDCRLRGEGVHHAMLGAARLHNLALSG
ncbi:transposase family protein [Streptomyces sp. NBC_00683]|uniref:transposase family protein n=1 Tax=Streptomyces sp. NBC_00683 TaxID=2903670 RepID=UPI003FA6A930